MSFKKVKEFCKSGTTELVVSLDGTTIMVSNPNVSGGYRYRVATLDETTGKLVLHSGLNIGLGLELGKHNEIITVRNA